MRQWRTGGAFLRYATVNAERKLEMADEETQGAAEEAEETQDAGGKQAEAEQERDDERTFTQSELEAIISDRLKRERQKYEDYDDLKSKAEQLDDIRKEQMSEQEKLETELEEAKTKAEQAEKRAQRIALKSAVVSKAASLDFADPEDAFAMLDTSELEVGDDGEVEGVEDALKDLAEAKPYLLKQDDNKPRPRRQSATNPGDNAQPHDESDEERAKRLGLA